jgi:hypothetical protein
MLVCLPFLALGQEAGGEDRPDLLSIVRAQHRAARESIRTFSADVTSEMTFPKKEVSRRGKYWRWFNTVRVQEYHSGTETIEDALLKNGEIRRVGRHRIAKDQYDRYGAGRDSSAAPLGICDVWRSMLMEFFGPSGARYDYDRFLDLANSPPRVEREMMDGHECIRVSMQCDTDTGDEWSLTFWHDVSCNYLIRKEAVIFGNKYKDLPCEYEVLEFWEAAPGVVVPLRARLRGYDHGKLQVEEMTILSNVRVNEPLAKNVFLLPPVPAGTVVHDRIEGTNYPIDANWNRIGPTTLGLFAPPPNRSASPATLSDARAEELKPLARWLLPAALVVLAAAGACWVYRRWQSQERQPARP